jgi:hypothetical protein
MISIKQELEPHKKTWISLLDDMIDRTRHLKISKKNKSRETRNLSDFDKIEDVFQKLKDPFGLPLKDRWLIYSAFMSKDDLAQITYINTRKSLRVNSLCNLFSDYERKRSKFVTFLKKFKYFGLPERLLPVISDVWLTVYADNYKVKYETVSGMDIVRTYEEMEIPGNCMGGNPNGCLDFYASNPERVELLVGYRDSIPCTRSLLWRVDDDKWYLDRNYTDGTGIIPRNIIEPILRGSDNYSLRTVSGKEYNIIDMARSDEPCTPSLKGETYYINELRIGDSGRVPYLDSFHYGDFVNGVLNITNLGGGCEFCFDDTEGNMVDPSSAGYVYDTVDGCFIRIVDAVELTSGDWCAIDYAYDTPDGYMLSHEVREICPMHYGYEYTSRETAVWDDVNDCYVHIDDCIKYKIDGFSTMYYTNNETDDFEIAEYHGIGEDDDGWYVSEICGIKYFVATTVAKF